MRRFQHTQWATRPNSRGPVTRNALDFSSEEEDSEEDHDENSSVESDWWDEMKPVKSGDYDATENVATFDDDVNGTENIPETSDDMSIYDDSNPLPKSKRKLNELLKICHHQTQPFTIAGNQCIFNGTIEIIRNGREIGMRSCS